MRVRACTSLQMEVPVGDGGDRGCTTFYSPSAAAPPPPFPNALTFDTLCGLMSGQSASLDSVKVVDVSAGGRYGATPRGRQWDGR